MSTYAGPFGFIAVGMGLLTIALLGSPLITAAALLALVLLSVVVLTRLTLGGAGVVCALGFALTTPWNAVTIGPVRPADVLLFIGLTLLLLSTGVRGWGRGGAILPWWLLLLALVIVAVTALNAVVPFAADYVRHRPDYDATGVVIQGVGSNFGGGARWLVSLLGVPTLICLAGEHRRAALGWLAASYAIGTAIAGLVAITDKFGVTSISASLIADRFGDRQASLTIQPNHLAAVCVFGVPFACWLFVSTASLFVRTVAAFAVLFDLLGVLFSGSRGGAAVGVLAVMFAVVLLRDLRVRALQIGLAAAIAMAAVLYANPDLVKLAGSTTRLSVTANAADSDQVRGVLGAQANVDFGKSPFYGIGLQVIVTAHNIYKQLLASGGVLLFVAFAIFIVGMVRAGKAAWAADQLAVAATVSVFSWLIFGAVENLLIDRYLYVSVGLLVALGVRHRRDRDLSPPGARSEENVSLVPRAAVQAP